MHIVCIYTGYFYYNNVVDVKNPFILILPNHQQSTFGMLHMF